MPTSFRRSVIATFFLGVVTSTACDSQRQAARQPNVQLSEKASGIEASSAQSTHRDPSDVVTCNDIKLTGMSEEDIEALATLTGGQVASTYGEAPIDFTNEAHDCQRLIVKSQYSTLGTLWAFARLKNAHFVKTPVVAIAMREGGYAPLKLHQGSQCLVLDDQDGIWKAWITKVKGNTKCAAGLDSLTELQIKRIPLKGEHPIAVRWIDTPHGYYIGFACAGQWCIVGPDIIPDGDVKITGGDGDRQRLAVKNGAGVIRPSKVWGTIQPVLVQHRDQVITYQEKWVTVAEMSFEGTDDSVVAKYAAKFGGNDFLTRTVPVQLMHTGTDSLKGWFVRYTKATKDVGQKAVFLTAIHSGPATVRWKWIENDEGTWTSCGLGCCGGGG